MASVSEMIEHLWRPPRTELGFRRPAMDRELPENFKYYGNWGFTIYRTYYSHESDEHWNMLLDALKRQTYLALGYLDDEELYEKDRERRQWGHWFYKTQDEYRNDLKRLKTLFHLDPREDPALLSGLSVRQLRKVCLDEHPGAQKTMAGGKFRYALVADEAVLKDIAKGEFVVKAVAYDWEEVNSSWGWGWLRIPTGYLLELWHTLLMSANNLWALRFDGPEEHLEEYIWPGDIATNPSGQASEIRPELAHYSAQRPRFKLGRDQQ